MNIRETFSYFSLLPACNGAANGLLAASNTGADIDRRGYDSLTFHINIRAMSTAVAPATSYWYVRMQHTDASALGLGPSDYADCASIDAIRMNSLAMTSGIFILNASTMSGTIQPLGYRGNKQYVRVLISTTGAMAAATSGVIHIAALLGHAENWPVQTPNLDA